MPLIKPRTHRVRILRYMSRLQEPNRDVLLAYARFIGETADCVLNALIDTTPAKDRTSSRGVPPGAGQPARRQCGIGRRTDMPRATERAR